jgi:hypothetical protein
MKKVPSKIWGVPFIQADTLNAAEFHRDNVASCYHCYGVASFLNYELIVDSWINLNGDYRYYIFYCEKCKNDPNRRTTRNGKRLAHIVYVPPEVVNKIREETVVHYRAMKSS